MVVKFIDTTDRETLHEFITNNTTEGTMIYTDNHRGYRYINREHHCILHGRYPYVDGQGPPMLKVF